MSQLIETIQIKNGEISLLPFHQKRMDKAIESLYLNKNTNDLHEIIQIPEHVKKGIWKCRIVYTTEILEITFTPYLYRIINTLKIIEAPTVTYNYKYEDRNDFQNLLKNKENCDDILITQHGFITDTSFSNIVFFNGKEWITPSTFLLEGTKRAYLLETKQIKEKTITVDDLQKYKKARLLNCFYDLEHGNDIEITSIKA